MGVAAADNLRGHWSSNLQERLVPAMEEQWTAHHGPRRAGELDIAVRIMMMAHAHAHARIVGQGGADAA
eukprot:scaffold13369_cov21-Phaeocystis_antarctica.AAC.1